MAIPLRLLIVTDSEDNALLIVRELRQAGYEPRWDRVDSKNGFAEMLDKRTWDVVISEYATPGFGGLEALETARQKDRDLPVIIVSGQIGEENAAGTIKAGASDFILRSHLERLPAAVKRELSWQKTAQSALGKSERLYRLLTENANDVIWSCDLSLAFQYVSPSVEKLLGWTPDEFISAGVTTTLPPESLRLAAGKLQIIQEQHRSGRRVFEPVIFEIEQNRKDGTRVWTEVSARPFLDGEGRMVGISGVTRDISERKRVEKALLQAKKEWERTFDSLPDLITVLDDRHRIVRVNRAMAERLGLTPGQCIGRTCYESIHGRNEPIASCPHALNLVDGQVHTAEVHEERLGGDFLVSCTALFDEEGVRIGAVHIARDITGRKRAEEGLRHAHERLQRFVDANIVGVVIARPAGAVVEANDYYLRTIGYTREEFEQGMVDWRAMTPPEWLPADEHAIAELRERRTCTPYEKEYVRRDGTRVSVILCDVMLPGPEEEIAAFVLDITDRKRAEAALRESEERFKQAFYTSPDAVNINRLEDGLYVDVNEGFTQLTGFTREDVIGKTSAEINIWCNLADRNELIRGLKEKGYYENLDARFRRKNGSVTTAQMSASIFSLQGVPHILSITRDITDRKRMEEELKQSEERFRMVVESAPDAIFVRSVSGHFVYLNDAAVRLFGAASSDQLIGMHIRERIPPEEYAAIADRIGRLNEGQAAPMIEQTFLRMDGCPVTVEVSAVPLRYEGANGALVFARDISERKRAERALRESERGLRQLQKMEAMGTLAGGIAHDFNNILAVMIGFTEMAMLETEELPDVHSNLEQVYKAGLRAQDLVRQILTFSRQSEQEKKPVCVSPLIKEAVKMLRATIPSSIQIRQTIHPRTSAIMADPTQIHQIVMNLVTNASHAVQEVGAGTIEITFIEETLDQKSAAIHPDLKPGKYIVLKVRDNGPGIPPGVIERIFDPFFTTKETGKGTGMGLAVVHGIVKSHGGAISVESQAGAGSTFAVYFPALAKETARLEDATEPIPCGAGRILFVDDEETLTSMGQLMLKRLGYEADIRTSSLDALDAFRANPLKYDLVITDYTMPGMTGMALSEELLKIRPDIPIILCTGYSEITTPEKAKAAGIRELIMKPVVLQQLAQAINKVLTTQRA
jgi:PAS domain S-box-containing protein